MQNITLYTNSCPKCKILKAKLDEKGIEYNICYDFDLMIEKGFKSMPMLEVDGNVFDFSAAIKFTQEMER